jgi:hypothetical protein
VALRDHTADNPRERLDKHRGIPTGEVGSEGGSPGDVEIVSNYGPGTGSEAGETWQPAAPRGRTIVRDERGEGRRSP